MTDIYKRSKGIKNWTRPADDSLMKLAQRENFALFILKGRYTHLLKGVVPESTIRQIELWQAHAIKQIKYAQELRVKKRTKGKSKGKSK